MKRFTIVMLCAGISAGLALGIGTETIITNIAGRTVAYVWQNEKSVQNESAGVIENVNESVLAGIANSTIASKTAAIEFLAQDAEHRFTAKDIYEILAYPSEEQK